MTDSPPPEFLSAGQGMRIPYMGKDEAFTEDQLVSKEPYAQFNNWFERAAQTAGIEGRMLCVLATATKDGRPSARMVLLKGYGPDGFKFLQTTQVVKRQNWLRIHMHLEFLLGAYEALCRVEKLSTEESTEYFMSRPVGSRIGAIISPQSKPIPKPQCPAGQGKGIDITDGATTKLNMQTRKLGRIRCHSRFSRILARSN
ncbi:Pyridoxine-5'-phosphate oxidase [Orchesella cincta]|uniref:pyridoxal 5'-phosphate synthase n=1 Tax=Orchesella cincta TaxID=48709 RepID=A0A1D2NBZ2_ORCCI|nr:Pyridoxine-5'-phosphate oxidase [Orchesella cincta]